jgi:hypothetical protein
MFRQTILACTAGVLVAGIAATGTAKPYDTYVGQTVRDTHAQYPPRLRLKMKLAMRRLARTQAQPACMAEEMPSRPQAEAGHELVIDIPPSAARIKIEVEDGGLTCTQARKAIETKTRAALTVLQGAGIKPSAITRGPVNIAQRTFEDDRWRGFSGTQVIFVTLGLERLPALLPKIGNAGTINDQRIVFRSAPDSSKAIGPDAMAQRQRRKEDDQVNASHPRACLPIIFDVVDYFGENHALYPCEEDHP